MVLGVMPCVQLQHLIWYGWKGMGWSCEHWGPILNSSLAVLRFNLVRVEICELRPEVVAESDEVLVHYRSRTNGR